MPNPANFKNKKEFMGACPNIVLKEGTTKDFDQAYAICISMWKKYLKDKKSKGGLVPEEEKDLKNLELNESLTIIDEVLKKI